MNKRRLTGSEKRKELVRKAIKPTLLALCLALWGLLFCELAAAAGKAEDLPGWRGCSRIVRSHYEGVFLCNINGQEIIVWSDGDWMKEMKWRPFGKLEEPKKRGAAN